MPTSPEAFEAMIFLALIVGFAAYVAFGPLPVAGQGISRMGYFVRFGAASLGSVLAMLAANWFFDIVAPRGYSDIHSLTVFAVSLATGVYFGILALGRSIDSGARRWFAAIAMVPILNLWLAFSAPAPGQPRPEYWPRNGFLRFLIGFTCVFLGVGAANFLSTASTSPQGQARLIEREIAGLRASLPKRLDDATVMTDVQHDARQSRVDYFYSLEGNMAGNTAKRSEILKNIVAPNICSDRETLALLSGGYSLHFHYASPGGEPIGSFGVAASDCR